MFIGSLSRWETEKRYLPPVFSKAMVLFFQRRPYLTRGNFEIGGRPVRVIFEEGVTKPVAERRFEAHRRFIDIQIVLKGRERMDYCTLPPNTLPLEDRMEKDDIAFYPEPPVVQTALLEEDQYAVFLPGELHAPNLAFAEPENHLKAIIKISADLVIPDGPIELEMPDEDPMEAGRKKKKFWQYIDL